MEGSEVVTDTAKTESVTKVFRPCNEIVTTEQGIRNTARV